MIGLLIAATGTILIEVGNSIGKWELLHKKETPYIMGFLHIFWGTLLFGVLILFRGHFDFKIESLPTFLPRVFLEILQIQIGILATKYAERSALGFITTGTIPLLLVVDFILGYTLSTFQILGMSLVVLTVLLLFINHGLSRKGIGYAIFITLNAVATISLFKYNITHFNSVEAEQGIVYLILLLYFLLASVFFNKVDPFSYLTRYPFSIQGISHGIGGIILSFAYLFGPASIIVTAKRAFSVLSSILFGHIYFHEKKLTTKLFAFVVILVGLFMLA